MNSNSSIDSNQSKRLKSRRDVTMRTIVRKFLKFYKKDFKRVMKMRHLKKVKKGKNLIELIKLYIETEHIELTKKPDKKYCKKAKDLFEEA